MEYLMTYGWAILVIAVVLGALFGLGVFNGGAVLGSGCVAQPGYLCQQPRLGANGTLFVNIGQVGQQKITITSIGCSSTASEPTLFSNLRPSLIVLSSQIAQGTPFQCPLVSNSIGASFTGTLWIQYTTSQYPGVTIPAEIGTVSTKVSMLGPGIMLSSTVSSSSSTSLSSSTSTIAPLVVMLSAPAPYATSGNTIVLSAYLSEGGAGAPYTLTWTGSVEGTLTSIASDCPTTSSLTIWTCTIAAPSVLSPTPDTYTVGVNDVDDTFASNSVTVEIDPAPLLLASGQGNPQDIAIDGSNVYWTNPGTSPNTGTVAYVPIGGGNVVVLANGQGEPLPISVEGGDVYWADVSGVSSLDYVAISCGLSCTPTVLAYGAGLAMTTDSGNVYWAPFQEDADIVSIPLIGGNILPLATSQNVPLSIAVDGSNAYWSDVVGDNITTAPLSGSGPTTVLASNLPSPGFIAIDGSNVYWTMPSAGTVDTVPKIGGSVTVLASGQEGPEGIAVEGGNIYWADRDAGTIDTMPVGGGNVVVLASGQNGPYGIAVDGSNVYWTNYNDGTIWQVAK